jgi:hypothetical protein
VVRGQQFAVGVKDIHYPAVHARCHRVHGEEHKEVPVRGVFNFHAPGWFVDVTDTFGSVKKPR